METLEIISVFPFVEARTTIPEREQIRTNYDRTAPVRILTHIGCAFATDREFFFEIGSYDDGMDIWGSENVELAFRVGSHSITKNFNQFGQMLYLLTPFGACRFGNVAAR